MKLLITLLSLSSFAAITPLINNDLNNQTQREEVINAQYDQGEIISHEVINVKMNALYKELNLNRQTISLPDITPSFTLGTKIKSSDINQALDELKSHVQSTRSSAASLADLASPFADITSYEALPFFQENTPILAADFNTKINHLKNATMKLSKNLRPTATTCLAILSENPSAANGEYRLKANDNSYYTTRCRFEGTNAFTMVASMVNWSGDKWQYFNSSWNNDNTNVNTEFDLEELGSVKTRAWSEVSGSELLITGATTGTKVNTIHNVNGTVGTFFTQGARTTCTTTYHSPASRYVPNDSWGVEYQDICFVNFYKSNNYNTSTGYARLLLQFSSVVGGNPYNTSFIHWNSHRAYGFYKHSGGENVSAYEPNGYVYNGGGTLNNPLSTEVAFRWYIKETLP